MWNPITAAQDFSRKRRLAHALLEELQRNRPHGVDIERRTDEEGVAALMWLLSKRSDVTVVKLKKGATLMFKRDTERAFAPAYQPIDRAGMFAEPGEDLFRAE